jgi:hypothetical protein
MKVSDITKSIHKSARRHFEGIAKGLDLTVDCLIEANPGIKPTQFQDGQKINLGNSASKSIPSPATAKPTPVTKPKAN